MSKMRRKQVVGRKNNLKHQEGDCSVALGGLESESSNEVLAKRWLQSSSKRQAAAPEDAATEPARVRAPGGCGDASSPAATVSHRGGDHRGGATGACPEPTPDYDAVELRDCGKENTRRGWVTSEDEAARTRSLERTEEEGEVEKGERRSCCLFPDEDSNQILPVEQFFGNLGAVQDCPLRPAGTESLNRREYRRLHYFAKEDSDEEAHQELQETTAS